LQALETMYNSPLVNGMVSFIVMVAVIIWCFPSVWFGLDTSEPNYA